MSFLHPRSRVFIKQKRNGAVVKCVREHYLRDDLSCGIQRCKHCQTLPQHYQSNKLSLSPATDTDTNTDTLYVIDTNVALHQMDLLESQLGLFESLNLVFPETVLSELKHNDKKVYNRLRVLIQQHSRAYVFSNEHHSDTYTVRLAGESPNDRNDRAIRQVCKFYQSHTDMITKVILLTQDRLNRELSLNQSLASLSMFEFVARHEKRFPLLRELLASVNAAEKEKERKAGQLYPPHLSVEATNTGLLNGSLKRGTFKVNRDYYSEAMVRVADVGEIFIPDFSHSNRAVDGDIVAVQLLPRDQWKRAASAVQSVMEEEEIVAVNNDESNDREDTTSTATSTETSSPLLPTGRVVSIIQRNWRAYCGSFELTSDPTRGSLLFLSVNRKIPKIRVQTQQGPLLIDKRILVQIDSWPNESRYPLGHYVSTIGDIGDKDTETRVLLIEHDIPTAPWSNAVLQCLPSNSHEIDQLHCAGRLDLRHITVFSIDPPGCTDIDDALHVRKLTNGNYECGVHIADVSHYVKPNTAIDAEAAHRGTSVYLVDRRIDMLPSLLSTNLCSLKSNVDRLTFSVLWEMNDRAEIVNTRYTKAVIHSRHSFTYAQAQDRIDLPDTNENLSDEVVWACKTLNQLAKQMKQKRINDGALMLASNEVKFLIDRQTSQPLDVEMYQLKESNSLVEEFMLLANISVAKKILEHFPTFALLRRHPTPSEDRFESLKRAAKIVGFDIDASSSRSLALSLDRAAITDQPFFNKLMRIMATRCMTQAIYFSSGEIEPHLYHHYGLAAPVYTHFTSPIRRYADIVVHRLLSSSLGIEALPNEIEDRERVKSMADTINHRHRMAQLVSRASAELFTIIFFARSAAADTGADRESRSERVVGDVLTEHALIVGVKATGFTVMIPRYGIEGTIVLHRKTKIQRADDSTIEIAANANPYHFDSETLSIEGPKGRFQIFQSVNVSICVKERSRRRWLNIELADGATPAAESAGVTNVQSLTSQPTPSKRRKTAVR